MNDQQLAAATAPNGFIQIIAGPGTGKTFTLVHRIVEFLRRGIDPNRIVVVTFTRAAAREVLDRVNDATNTRTNIVIGTFHSVALRLLRRFGGENYRKLSLIDEHEKIDLLRTMDSVSSTDIRRVANEISRIKAQEDAAALADPLLKTIYEQYESKLRLLNRTDFDGLLLLFRRLLESTDAVSNVVDAVLVDEFQDTSLLQLDISMLLAKRCGNMTVVGDPDQSIYGFRNADLRNFVRMAERSHVQKWYLENNYRSEQAILTAATRVIQSSQQRYAGDRQLLAAKHNTNVEVQFIRSMSPQSEAQAIVTSIRFLLDSGIRGNEICILSRYTSKFESIETALLTNGIPNKLVGGKRIAERKEVRLIIDYMRVVLDGNDALAVERTVNNPRRGIGEKTLSQLRDHDGLLTLSRVRNLGTEQSRKYTSIIDAARMILASVPRNDITSATEQAIAIVNKLAMSIFDIDTTPDASQVSAHVAAIKSALQQFQILYEDIDEDDDRTFLEAFLDQWALGTDVNDAEKHDQENLGKVTLSTIHSAKGLEWPVVYMLDVSEEDGPIGSKKDSDEDRRLLYVAMTRAKSILVVSSANAKMGFDKLLNVPQNAVKNEFTTPNMESLGFCVGRQLLKRQMVPRRSVLSKSKRFDAKAPIELPPGFQLASELPQTFTQSQKRSTPLRSKPSPDSIPERESLKIAKKASKQPRGTLLSFWGTQSK